MDDTEEAFSMCSLQDTHAKVKTITVELKVHGENVKSELDAALHLQSAFKAQWNNAKKMWGKPV